MFAYDLSAKLKTLSSKLSKKDPVLALALKKKIEQVVSCDEVGIEHYPDSSYHLVGFKHVHVASSFVLFFRVFKNENYIVFDRLEHHDKAFRH